MITTTQIEEFVKSLSPEVKEKAFINVLADFCNECAVDDTVELDRYVSDCSDIFDRMKEHENDPSSN